MELTIFFFQDNLVPQDFQVPKVLEAQKVMWEHQAARASLAHHVSQAYQDHLDSEVSWACQDLKVHNSQQAASQL